MPALIVRNDPVRAGEPRGGPKPRFARTANAVDAQDDRSLVTPLLDRCHGAVAELDSALYALHLEKIRRAPILERQLGNA